ncbi:transcription termination/antitermination protein NusG [Corynebacterium sp. P3-F1]|uniref:transcription termination/antitermination protein NusG n=1 Tax=Corynebacterium sp. P3-F1 TaxID=3059080 RepID=UPI00265D486A|nr:transcription termination/antitermination protein NusG [Corynebacterium sp. P3-F1]WKK60827.1 transcription termination/antitermination protein NusG [Corynebacterium sp. P3-F1]
MADDNQYSKEANEAEMVGEGGAVQESTDPEPTDGDSSEGESDSDTDGASAESEAGTEYESADTTDLQSEEMVAEGDVPEQPVQEADAEGVTDPEAALGAEPEENADAEYKRRLREYTRELKKLPGSWYIIQSYSGYENKVKTNLDMRIQTLEVEDSIYDVVVPIEQVVELKDGKKKIVKRKLLPGYVLVRMDINDAAWSVVRETPGVTSFVGNEGNATPVKHRDVAKFLMPKEPKVDADLSKTDANAEGETVIAMPEEESKPKVAHDFQVGEAVTILSGALASVSATINEIDPETGKIQALVSIFGRETPVELTADQIERIM